MHGTGLSSGPHEGNTPLHCVCQFPTTPVRVVSSILNAASVIPFQIHTLRRSTETGKLLEPYEEVVVDVDSDHSSTVVGYLTGDRKGIMMESEITSDGKSRLVFEVPSRGLLGFSSEIATATKGSAVVNHLFLENREHAGNLGTGLEKGKLVSNESGKATSYALQTLSQRGTTVICLFLS